MDYQERVNEAFETLVHARSQVLTAMINVALSSEFSDVDEHFENGDECTFRVGDFEQAKDPNVRSMLGLLTEIERVAAGLDQ